jgi:cohesin complex subunit SA-1/2
VVWGICSSVVRSFRFTATLTAQQVVTSIIKAMLLLGEARETAQRQMAAEQKKKGSKVSVGLVRGACPIMVRGRADEHDRDLLASP